MNRIRIFLLSFLLTNVLSGAPLTAGKAHAVSLDTCYRSYVPVSDKIIDTYRNNHNFHYISAKPIQSDFMKMLMFKISKILQFLFANKISNWVISSFFILLFVILLLSLLGINVRSVFSRPKNYSDPLDPFMQIIGAQDNFDELIQRAQTAGQYNFAIRYLYIKLLHILSDKNLIFWQKDKTNRDYLFELDNTSFASDFKQITSAYEYIWYGKFPCSQLRYEQLRDQFSLFYIQLNG